MAKQPYRPLYIGDHDRECNSISLEAEGALVKIKNKLWDSKTPGLLSFCFSNLCVLLKNPPEKVHKIIAELNDFTTVFVKNLPENRVEIGCSEMIEKAELSKVRSESGSKGGRPKKPNQKQNKTKSKANTKQNTENESVIEIENEIKEGAKVEKNNFLPPSQAMVEQIFKESGLPETEGAEFYLWVSGAKGWENLNNWLDYTMATVKRKIGEKQNKKNGSSKRDQRREPIPGASFGEL